MVNYFFDEENNHKQKYFLKLNPSKQDPSKYKNAKTYQSQKKNFISILLNTPPNHRYKSIVIHSRMQQIIGTRKYDLVQQCYKTAENIRELAILAFLKGVKIRVFDYNKNNTPKGGEFFLRPVNSVEVISFKKDISNHLNYLSLSVQNSKSLVFQSPKAEGNPGVLFCADSNFSFSRENSLNFLDETYLITAPHHGSKSNASVYKKIAKQLPLTASTVFVRSDFASSKKRPCDDYLDLKNARRVCTNCRHPDSREGQTVQLISKNGRWELFNPDSRIIWCHCLK